uniref:Uncharacterized protein n=1 Tax=Octopus bimaculoides TaxID=37653 RepID=A0A0L8HH21_OCTBM
MTSLHSHIEASSVAQGYGVENFSYSIDWRSDERISASHAREHITELTRKET